MAGSIDEVTARASPESQSDEPSSEERKYRSYGFHLYLEMLSPEDIFFSGNAQQIILPAIDGSHGILPGHEPMVTVITAGELRFQDEKGNGIWL